MPIAPTTAPHDHQPNEVPAMPTTGGRQALGRSLLAINKSATAPPEDASIEDLSAELLDEDLGQDEIDAMFNG